MYSKTKGHTEKQIDMSKKDVIFSWGMSRSPIIEIGQIITKILNSYEGSIMATEVVN